MNNELSDRELAVGRALTARVGRLVAAAAFLLVAAMAAPMLGRAANEAANLDQCRNGTFAAPAQCADSAWVNGNIGETNSHYREGDSVPFRATLTNIDLAVASHTLVIQYDTLQSGKHAYDYLTSYNRTETDANANTGFSPALTAGNCFPIPIDLTLSFANPSSTQASGCIQIWNGTISNVSYGTMDTTGQRSVIVTFSATDSTVLLAWGGHIASQIDWGAGNSAGSISGSPYHMRLLTLDNSKLGNQDRSLKAAAIQPVPAVFTTQASSSQITIGQSVTDTATLSGTNGEVTGTVKFFVCGPAASNPDCTSGGAEVGTAVTISAGQATSASFTPSTPGHYCFRAEYTPDEFAPYSASNETDQTNECFTVMQRSPTLTTNAGPAITLGASGSNLSDSATLSGATNDASGTITFHLYLGNDCSAANEVSGSPVTASVSGNATYASPAIHITTAGTYRWVANYGGDTNNSATANGCNGANENVVVSPRTTTLTTDAGGPYTLQDGTVNLTDTATLSGGSADATGTITFKLYGPDPTGASDPSDDCTEATLVDTASATVNGADGKQYISSPPITVSDPGMYHWTASYSGDAANGASTSDCGAANETAHVIGPHISVTKTPASQTIVSGSPANFTIQVINDGDSTLTDVHVTDALAPGCARDKNDIAGLASMPPAPAPGSTITYNCSLANVTASFTNVAVATGTTEAETEVTAQASANVTVIHPHISISKTPHSQTVAFAGTVTFTITVTNDGDATLTNVRVTDAQAPGCARTSADIAQLGSMAPGDHLSYTCTLANVTSDFTNVAVVIATPPVGAAVTASDTAAVTVGAAPTPAAPVPHPAISIVKNPQSQVITRGGTATFRITVTNTGDVPLTGVTVADARSPDCNRSIGTLAPGASVSYTCKRANVQASFNNVAVATGTAGTTTVRAQGTAPVTAKAPFVPKKVKTKRVVAKVVSHHKARFTG